MPAPVSFTLQLQCQTVLTALSLKELVILLSGKECPVIADRKVVSLYPDLFVSDSERLLMLPAGEHYKNNSAVSRIHRFLLQCRTARNTEVIVLGGGTVTDTAAYAVSTFKRGCRLTLVPTTLLGMVDAAVGGKTAINSNGIRNLIGTFYPADRIIIIPDFLRTLSHKELLNGLVEMLKLRCIKRDLPDPVSILTDRNDQDLILSYASSKLEICARDPLDRKERRLLNLGHTFAHVLESIPGNGFSHGEAVAWGVAVAARLSCKLGLIDSNALEQIIEPFQKCGFELTLSPLIRETFLAAFPRLAVQDKKAVHQDLTLILFTAPHQVKAVDSIALDTVLPMLQI